MPETDFFFLNAGKYGKRPYPALLYTYIYRSLLLDSAAMILPSSLGSFRAVLCRVYFRQDRYRWLHDAARSQTDWRFVFKTLHTDKVSWRSVEKTKHLMSECQLVGAKRHWSFSEEMSDKFSKPVKTNLQASVENWRRNESTDYLGCERRWKGNMELSG